MSESETTTPTLEWALVEALQKAQMEDESEPGAGDLRPLDIWKLDRVELSSTGLEVNFKSADEEDFERLRNDKLVVRSLVQMARELGGATDIPELLGAATAAAVTAFEEGELDGDWGADEADAVLEHTDAFSNVSIEDGIHLIAQSFQAEYVAVPHAAVAVFSYGDVLMLANQRVEMMLRDPSAQLRGKAELSVFSGEYHLPFPGEIDPPAEADIVVAISELRVLGAKILSFLFD